ncbi:hypothetical protein [Streptomyces profundus]|uniref:hypothetical protein n=1 Tax=Streptomyces profundus TaxID=2867410 RepID=UPI001D1665B1|nr:hypothetical protein [Streptomyces sp. MA3_2.13]UED87461.1 hypothetical protein K4G22_27420 [Streptomyces sp. MA3_2.13]
MPKRESEPDFADELRGAAEALDVGPAPVDELIRRGRALRRRRRRLAVTGAASAGVLAAGLAAGLAWTPVGPGSADPAPPAGRTSPPFPDDDERREVRPYERLAINDAFVMGLLPEGNQNYVVSSPASFDEDMAAARGHFGDNLGPRSVSVGYQANDGDVLLIDGAWRLDETPARILIEPEGWGDPLPATLVQLAGESDWGVYYLDAGRHPGFPGEFRVVAYDAQGEVLAEKDVSSFF